MKKKLLSLIVAIGLTLGSATQITATPPGLGEVPSIKPVGLGIISALAHELKQEEEQKKRAVLAQDYYKAAFDADGIAIAETNGLRRVVAYAYKVWGDDKPRITVAYQTWLRYNLGLDNMSRHEVLSSNPLLTPRAHESIADYVDRCETQKKLLVRKYADRKLQLEESSADDERA